MQISKINVGLVIIAGIVGCAISGEPSKGQQTIGGQRFQLLQGHYQAAGPTQVVDMNSIFKIDSQTGQTWEYSSGLSRTGEPQKFWFPIEQH